ncbi:MAG TPA: serine/threonine-protein kinase, partial [Polyangiaceae bacterium]|nr:serine/threonine-protein kinase [Polyangiaceae bacterium]
MPEEPKQGSKLGNYELVLRVGRGGMAAVWVARERAATTKDDRLVAVKVMLTELADESEFVKMFLDEVRLVRSIRHPNVVDVYDVGEDDGMMWMAMEWVEGESLHTVIAEAGKRRAIPPELAVRIIADAAAGLHAAHELRDLDGSLRGVVHRDISPHNILIGTNGS